LLDHPRRLLFGHAVRGEFGRDPDAAQEGAQPRRRPREIAVEDRSENRVAFRVPAERALEAPSEA
jgi:hypothetical protein